MLKQCPQNTKKSNNNCQVIFTIPHVSFLLLPRQSPLSLSLAEGEVSRDELRVVVDLLAGLGPQQLSDGAVVVTKDGTEETKVRDFCSSPAWRKRLLARGEVGRWFSFCAPAVISTIVAANFRTDLDIDSNMKEIVT